MASDLRAKLEKLATSELNLAHLRVGAQLALESVPCRGCDPDNSVQCDRCQRLASLASEGKGG
jgi:hypothetical protein